MKVELDLWRPAGRDQYEWAETALYNENQARAWIRCGYVLVGDFGYTYRSQEDLDKLFN